MSLTLCPCGENAPMQAVNRHGVEIDVCTRCRGVWLDRGELDKLLELARGAPDTSTQPPPQAPRPAYEERPPQREYRQGDRYRDYDDDDDRRGGYGQPHKKKKGLDFFDLFD